MKTNAEKGEIFSRVQAQYPRPKSVFTIPPELHAPWHNHPEFPGTFLRNIDPILSKILQSESNYTSVHNLMKSSPDSAPIVERQIREVRNIPARLVSFLIENGGFTINPRVINGHELSLDNLAISNLMNPDTKLKSNQVTELRYTTWPATNISQSEAIESYVQTLMEKMKDPNTILQAELAHTFTKMMTNSGQGTGPVIHPEHREIEQFGLAIKMDVESLNFDVHEQNEQLKGWIFQEILSGKKSEILNLFGMNSISQLEEFIQELEKRTKAYSGIDFVKTAEGTFIRPVEQINVVLGVDPKDFLGNKKPHRVFSAYPMQVDPPDSKLLKTMEEVSAERLAKITKKPTSKV